MKVWFSTHLRAYTKAPEVEVPDQPTVGAVVDELDRRFPGLKFRIVDEQDRVREHIAIFVRQEKAYDLGYGLKQGDDIRIIGALSGG